MCRDSPVESYTCNYEFHSDAGLAGLQGGFIGTAGMQDSVLRDLQYPKELETRTVCIEWPPAEATA